MYFLFVVSSEVDFGEVDAGKRYKHQMDAGRTERGNCINMTIHLNLTLRPKHSSH